MPLYLSSSYLLNDAEATGIVNIESSPLSIGRSDAVWYSLDGKKLSGQPTTKGIYIYQGKKYIK